MLLCTDSGTCGTEDQTILLRMIVDWYTGFIFSSTSVEFNFWQPIFWKLSLANRIGFCTEKYVSKPSVIFGSHLLATCCAYLAISWHWNRNLEAINLFGTFLTWITSNVWLVSTFPRKAKPVQLWTKFLGNLCLRECDQFVQSYGQPQHFLKSPECSNTCEQAVYISE